jgi:hypothetical protein
MKNEFFSQQNSIIPFRNSTDVIWLRRKGINSTKNLFPEDERGTLFEKSLKNWDARYDPYDRKIKAYGTRSKDFSWVLQSWWQDFYKAWDYVLHNWQLYKAKVDTNYTTIPNETERQPVISISRELPQDNSNLFLINGFAQAPSLWAWRHLIPWDYQSWWWNDNFYDPNWIWIPRDGYYIINSKEQRLDRPWFTSIASKIEYNFGSWRQTLTEYRLSSPTITVSWPETINQWTISRSTTMNTWTWYLKRWRIIRNSVYYSWFSTVIEYDEINVTRLF